MAPVVNRLQDDDICEVRVCLTGQHREMLDQFVKIFDLRVDYDLNVMRENQTLTDVTSNVLIGMEKVFAQWKPDCVLVQGDTTTTFAAALAAFYHKIKVGHVEAGLRTYHRYSPFPEEMNRCLVSELASMHFAPTQCSRQNLIEEGIDSEDIFVVGNTVIDALYCALEHINKNTELSEELGRQFQFLDHHKKLILVTGHRRENHGEGFCSICQALHDVALRGDVQIVYPVHLNPNVKKTVYEMLKDLSDVYLIEPLDYLSFTYLMRESYLIVTDSGGVQEEASSLGKPLLVMRDTTERMEAIDAGTALLVGPGRDAIVQNVTRLLDDQATYEKMSLTQNPYGDGRAAERIIEALRKR